MDFRRVFLIAVKRLLAASLALAYLLLVNAPALAASTPNVPIQFVAPLTQNASQESLIKTTLQKIANGYPEITEFKLGRFYVGPTADMQRECGSKNAAACYAPSYRWIYLAPEHMDDFTIGHELVHSSIVDTSGSIRNQYYDAVEEGVADYLSQNILGHGTKGNGYPPYEAVIKRLVTVLGTVSGSDGVQELRTIAFKEGKQAGINRRLSPYVSNSNPFNTLNYYLKTESYSQADTWLNEVVTNYQAQAANVTPSPTTETYPRFTNVFIKHIDNPADPKKATVEVYWKIDQTVPYEIGIYENGEVKTVLRPEDAKGGKYTYPIDKPYNATIDVDLVAEYKGIKEVQDSKTVTLNVLAPGGATSSATASPGSGIGGTTGSGGTGAGTGTASPAQVDAIGLVPSSVTSKLDGKDKIKLHWELNRKPIAGESVGVKIYNAKTGALLLSKDVSAIQGDESVKLTGVKDGDGLSVQLIDKKLNKQIGNTVKLAVGGSGGTDGGAASSSTPAPAEKSAEDCGQGGAFFFCKTLFGENVSASDYLLKAYFWAVGIAIFGAAAAITYAGYKYAMSRGNPSELTSAKEIIFSAIIGLVLLLLSFTILRFLGVNIG